VVTSTTAKPPGFTSMAKSWVSRAPEPAAVMRTRVGAGGDGDAGDEDEGGEEGPAAGVGLVGGDHGSLGGEGGEQADDRAGAVLGLVAGGAGSLGDGGADDEAGDRGADDLGLEGLVFADDLGVEVGGELERRAPGRRC
jgi:hypothetical protein